MKALEVRNLHGVFGGCVKGPVTAMTYLNAEIGTEPFRLFDPLVISEHWQSGRRVSVDLTTVENGVSAGEDAMTAIVPIGFVAVIFAIFASADLPEHNGGAVFATTHLGAFRIPLLPCAPDAAAISSWVAAAHNARMFTPRYGLFDVTLIGREPLLPSWCHGIRNSPVPASIAAMILVVMRL